MFVYSYQDPFEDYKTRLAKKLARKAEGGEKNDTEAKESNKIDSIKAQLLTEGYNEDDIPIGEDREGVPTELVKLLEKPHKLTLKSSYPSPSPFTMRGRQKM